jgi:hypothetical protein
VAAWSRWLEGEAARTRGQVNWQERVINIFKAWWVREQRGLDLEALVARPEISSVRIEHPDRLFLMWKTFL